MQKPGAAADQLPSRLSLTSLGEAARDCRACPLWRDATQTVFGEGRKGARLVLVGEQPGDHEDLEGRPFVGPAGRLLDEALEEAGIERRDAYLTNAVKHFKWTPRGTRRIHQKPNASEVAACRPWLEAELQVVEPRVLVCLGAVASQALLGRGVRVTKDRGRPFETELAAVAFATVHPSSILRAPDATSRKRERAQFVDDLRVAAAALANLGLSRPSRSRATSTRGRSPRTSRR